MVVNPVIIDPEASLADALTLMKQHGITGIPVVEPDPFDKPGRLVGILTNRDVRFATDPRQRVRELMTKEATGNGTGRGWARKRRSACSTNTGSKSGPWWTTSTVARLDHRQGHQRKAVANPNACKDEQGRLRVAAATTAGTEGFERAEAAHSSWCRPRHR